jgi:hypothetical protein
VATQGGYNVSGNGLVGEEMLTKVFFGANFQRWEAKEGGVRANEDGRREQTRRESAKVIVSLSCGI